MTLTQLNSLPIPQLIQELTNCCGATKWVDNMAEIFPVVSVDKLLQKAELIWEDCNADDWKEAFLHHPKIGDLSMLKERFANTSQWAENEQAGIQDTTTNILEALTESNKQYEEKFGYIFIVCATGMLAEEMLSLLTLRLLNNPDDEIEIAAEEQNKITLLRLKKLLS